MRSEKIESDNMERFQYASRAEGVAGEDSYAVKEDGNEPQSPKELIKEFCSYTSTHGVGRLAEAKTLFTRSIWTVFILGAFAMFVYQTSGLFKLYLRRPVSTAVKEQYKSKVTFPAVTVCNENTIRRDNVAEATIGAMFDKADKIVQREKENIYQEGGQNVTEDHYNDGRRSDYIFEQLFRLYLTRHNYTTLSKMGNQYKYFVFDCNFRGKDCRIDYPKYWHQFWDFRYGNCFTFNGGMDDEYQKQTVLETRASGSSGGLTLNLFVEIFQYLQFVPVSGARIAIHDQGKMPFLEENGIDLATGNSYSIGVRRKIFKRVDPFNNGSCRDAARYDDEDLYRKKFGSVYSRETCISSCLARVQIKNCGCAELKYPVDARLVCNKIDDPGKGKCLDDLYQNLNDDPDFVNCDLNCSVPCSDVIFETTVSSVLWPSGSYEGKLTNYLKARPLKPEDKEALNEQGSEFVKLNLLQVKVFFDQLNFQEVQEELSYKEVNLIADIGGQLGLWIGISVLTCCEVLELVLLLIQSLFKRVAANAGRVESRQ